MPLEGSVLGWGDLRSGPRFLLRMVIATHSGIILIFFQILFEFWYGGEKLDETVVIDRGAPKVTTYCLRNNCGSQSSILRRTLPYGIELSGGEVCVAFLD